MDLKRWNARRGMCASVAVLGALLMTACSQNMALAPNESDDKSGQPGAPSFTQFQDIPIPTGASMNMDRTFIFGAQDAWIGRLVLRAGHSAAAMFDFYKANAPTFGWEEITTVRSATSVLTYSRGERVLTVQIQAHAITGSEIDITVSPRGASAPTAAGPGARTGGAPTVPVQRGQ